MVVLNQELIAVHVVSFRSCLSIYMSELALKIEFGGGLELLFDKKRSHRITIPASVPASSSLAALESLKKAADINYLIHWLKDHLLKERAELFVEGGTVYVLAFFMLALLVNDVSSGGPGSLSWLMIRTGSSREKETTISRMATRLCLSLRCMAAEG